MQDALGIVIFVVVGVGAVIAVVSLFGRSRLYDDIGRGGLSIGEDRDMRPRAPASAPVPMIENIAAVASTPGAPASANTTR